MDKATLAYIERLIEEASNEIAMRYLKALTDKGISYRVDFDKDYGIDKQTGFSFTVNGTVCSQFEPSFYEAVSKGIRWFLELKRQERQ